MPYTVLHENRSECNGSRGWTQSYIRYFISTRKRFQANEISRTFNIIEQLEDLARNTVILRSKLFHCALFDSIACYLCFEEFRKG